MAGGSHRGRWASPPPSQGLLADRVISLLLFMKVVYVYSVRARSSEIRRALQVESAS